MDRLTTQFKVLISFVLILVAFGFLGFNQALLSKEVSTAITTSDQAVKISNQTYKDVKALVPTVTPTATPSATLAPKKTMTVAPTVKK